MNVGRSKGECFDDSLKMRVHMYIHISNIVYENELAYVGIVQLCCMRHEVKPYK